MNAHIVPSNPLLKLNWRVCEVAKASAMLRRKARDDAPHAAHGLVDDFAMPLPKCFHLGSVCRDQGLGNSETLRVDQSQLMWLRLVRGHSRRSVHNACRGKFGPAQYRVVESRGMRHSVRRRVCKGRQPHRVVGPQVSRGDVAQCHFARSRSQRTFYHPIH